MRDPTTGRQKFLHGLPLDSSYNSAQWVAAIFLRCRPRSATVNVSTRARKSRLLPCARRDCAATLIGHEVLRS